MLPYTTKFSRCIIFAVFTDFSNPRELSSRNWLGVPFHNDFYSCPECHSIADIYGDDQVGCGGNGDRIFQRNAIRDVIFSAAQSAALVPLKETTGLMPNSLSRPADIFLPNWSRGRPVALDVHVISPFNNKRLGRLLPPQAMPFRLGPGAS